MSRKTTDERIPDKFHLRFPTFQAIKDLGGSARVSEIVTKVIQDLNIPDDVAEILHSGSTTQTELYYRLCWTRTYLKNGGFIESSSRGVWSITTEYASKPLDEIKSLVNADREEYLSSTDIDTNDADLPEEVRPWKEQLSEVLTSMNPYGFERLAQRLLRECGFTDVRVTKKSGDGGIDGTAKLLINGIFSFNVAFQCKRYNGSVGAPEVRDFRGSLTTNIEKGILITTGSFTRAAVEEASNPGKKQIDLIDGETFINKLAEYGLGVKPVTTYEIDRTFFEQI